MERWAILVILLLASIRGHSQTRFANFPFAKRSISPDGRFTLVNRNCINRDCKDIDRKLWLINNKTNDRKLLIEIERNVRIGWAPVGNTFFLNDNLGSNVAEAYLYFPAEDRRVNIGESIDQKIPSDRHFENDSHHYFNALYWINGTSFLVKRFGHLDTEGAQGFTVCYRVNISGEVQRLSQSGYEGTPCELRAK
ncbi:MAG: hypothetical protein ACLPPV_13750 [Candidatus Korobacteraceae bacterium]|jgi:hypothetical protein